MRRQQRLQVVAFHRQADAEEAKEVSDARVCHRLALGEQIHLNKTRIPISNPDFEIRLVSTFIRGLSKPAQVHLDRRLQAAADMTTGDLNKPSAKLTSEGLLYGRCPMARIELRLYPSARRISPSS